MRRPSRKSVGLTVAVAAVAALLVVALGPVLPTPLKEALRPSCAATRPGVGAPPWGPRPRRSAGWPPRRSATDHPW